MSEDGLADELATVLAEVIAAQQAPPAAPSEPPPRRPWRHKRRTSRQARRLRIVLIVSGILLLTALTMASVMITMHGVSFFIFRAGGTGQSADNGHNDEAQGPGQPDAPKPTQAALHPKKKQPPMACHIPVKRMS